MAIKIFIIANICFKLMNINVQFKFQHSESIEIILTNVFQARIFVGTYATNQYCFLHPNQGLSN